MDVKIGVIKQRRLSSSENMVATQEPEGAKLWGKKYLRKL